jgi:hypothetical protein
MPKRLSESLEEFIEEADAWQNHKIGLIREYCAREIAARKVLGIPKNDVLTDEQMAKIDSLASGILVDMYRAVEIQLRVPVFSTESDLPELEPSLVLEFKEVSAAATIILVDEILERIKPLNAAPDARQARTYDYIARICMETERIFRNMISAVSSTEELHLIEKVIATEKQRSRGGRSKAQSYTAYYKDLFEEAKKWWAICPNISCADIARHFNEQQASNESKNYKLLQDKTAADKLKHCEFTPPEAKKGGRRKAEHTIRYISKQKPPTC